MNPLHWKREHQLALAISIALGAIAGVLFAWFDSPLYRLSRASLSGPLADPTQVFFLWLPHVELYWPWPVLGAVILGSLFYVARLFKA